MGDSSTMRYPRGTFCDAARDEWLETDGLGGFASGTVAGLRTRRYHALLLVATTPPTGRMVLLNGFEGRVSTPEGDFPFTSQKYTPGVVHPDCTQQVVSFTPDPWPTWHLRVTDDITVIQEIFVPRGEAMVALSWRLAQPSKGARLAIRPLISGREYHSLHHENSAFNFDADVRDQRVTFRPYAGVPPIAFHTNGTYRHEPLWYRNFHYDEERARGFGFAEDLASPGVFDFDASKGAAVWIVAAAEPQAPGKAEKDKERSAAKRFAALRAAEEKRRAKFPSRLHRSAEDYLVRRGRGSTIVAGYPWFTDWGRDTFISLRGLTLATGRLEEAREILVEWAGHVSEGMLPNRFPDHGEAPEYNSADASLWYVIAVANYLRAVAAKNGKRSRKEEKVLYDSVQAILAGYSRGTRFGIRMDDDALLAAGVPGLQLTWMDAKISDWVVTPRIGKPVELQALWLNALAIGAAFDKAWLKPLERGRDSFAARFWNPDGDCLYDVVDVNHESGSVDASLRPNQVFAVGGLPVPLIAGARARRVVDVIEDRLWTPMGLRSLAPGHPSYAAHYEGGVWERDGAYHQGTVWPWLIGPFIEAWVRVRGDTSSARTQARARFLAPILDHLNEAGLGHVAEIADGDPPHTPRGCPFQAWSVGEILRVTHDVLDANGTPGKLSKRKKHKAKHDKHGKHKKMKGPKSLSK